MKDAIKSIGGILMLALTIWLISVLIRSCENAEKPNSSFVKEIAKESRKVYDDFREGFGLNHDNIKPDTAKQDTAHIDDWMKHN